MAFETIDVSNYLADGAACFCGSNLLYKFCHKNKLYRNPAEIAIDQAKFQKAQLSCPFTSEGYRCSKPTINSHSIQRGAALRVIAEQHHVSGFSTGPNAKTSRPHTNLHFQKIPISKASTFQGFCAEHDALVFKELEANALSPSFEIALRLAIRSAIYEAITHSSSALFLNWLVTIPKFEFNFDRKVVLPELENMLYYSGYNWDLVRRLQKRLSGDRIHRFNFFMAKFECQLPFSCSGCFCIELDFNGKKIQKFSDFGKKFNYAQISVLPQVDGTTIFSVSALCDQDKIAAQSFIKSLSEQPRSSLADCALRAALVHSENTYFSPGFISDLSEHHRNALLKRFDDSAVAQVGLEKHPNALSEPLPFLLNKSASQVVLNIAR